MKNALIIILFILVCAAAWWIFFNPPKQNTLQKTATEYVKTEVEDLDRKTNENGIETVIADVTDKYLTQAGLKTATDSAGIIDSVLRLLGEERGAKNRALESYTQARAEIRRLQAVMLEDDTSFSYRDKWLTVAVKKPSGDKPALLSSTYNAELNWIWYRERKTWLSPLRTYGRFSLNDPNATITGLKHIRIEPPADNFGFSVQAIGDYSPRGDIYMGIGATIRTGRVRLQGAYMNDMRGQWRPAFRGTYDLIDW